MSEQVDDLFEETIDLVQRYGKCLLNDPNCDVEQEWSVLLPIMEHLCDTLEKHSISQKIFNEFVDKLEESSDNLDETDDSDIIETYKDKLNKSFNPLKLGENNKIYKEFKNLMLNNLSKKHEESDIATVSENINLLDPITKLRLTDPVKNVKCGHTYEKASILQLISRKKNVKCPIPGCIAAASVKKSDLVPDTALKRYLERNQDA